MDKYRIECIIPQFIVKDIINYTLNDEAYNSFEVGRTDNPFTWKFSVTSVDKTKLEELSKYILNKINVTEKPEILNGNVKPTDRMCINCTGYCNGKCSTHNTSVLYYDLCKSFNNKHEKGCV